MLLLFGVSDDLDSVTQLWLHNAMNNNEVFETDDDSSWQQIAGSATGWVLDSWGSDTTQGEADVIANYLMDHELMRRVGAAGEILEVRDMDADQFNNVCVIAINEACAALADPTHRGRVIEALRDCWQFAEGMVQDDLDVEIAADEIIAGRVTPDSNEGAISDFVMSLAFGVMMQSGPWWVGEA